MGGISMKPFNLGEYLKNPSRKIVKRDGREVTRILCTDAKGHFPIVALVESFDGENETSISYTNKGHLFDGADYNPDLFFAPEKHEGWVNVFKSSKGNNVITSDIFESKEEAEEVGKNYNNYIVTAKVEWEE